MPIAYLKCDIEQCVTAPPRQGLAAVVQTLKGKSSGVEEYAW